MKVKKPVSQFKLNNLGIAAVEKGRLGQACNIFSDALRLKPSDPVTLNNLGNALVSYGRITEGIHYLRKSVKLRPVYYDALCNLGRAYRRAGDAQSGMSYLERAVRLQPDNPIGLILLAESLSNLGFQEKSLPIYERCVMEEMRFADAIYGLSSAATCTDEIWLRRAQNYLNNPQLSRDDKILVHYAAGKLAQDLHKYEAAFQHFEQAKFNQNFSFDLERYQKRIDTLRQTFSPAFFDSRKSWGNPTEKLVFIVGMPRSGTTLTEQILAAHTQVHGAGELPYVTDVANGLGYSDISGNWFMSSVQSLEIFKTRSLAKEYLDRISLPPGKSVHVDKMPHNFEQIGLIKLLFPNAKIIHCLRDPIDTCLSCYTNFFNEHHGYSSDLTTLAKYYKKYRSLMDHWGIVFGDEIFTVQYEEMIEDSELLINRLLQFVGLPFDPSCLQSHKIQRSVGTISRWQVRQPIYSTSVRRWERYGSSVKPLVDALSEYQLGSN